jgi:secreted trypsin-like serine protease
MNRQFENAVHLEKETKRIMNVRCIMILIASVLVIVTIVLIISITLVFTIGRPTTVDSISSSFSVITVTTLSTTSSSLATSVLTEPCGCGCPTVNPQFNVLRVVSGETAKANSWPWQLLLIVYASNGIWSSYCGASLISHRHVLTAAHCVYGHSPRFVYTFAGQHELNLDVSSSAGFESVAIYVHESYDQVSGRNDIAIVILKEPMYFDAHVSPVCLARPASPGSMLQPNDTLIITGWGRLSGEPNSTSIPSHLQQAKLAYVPLAHPLCIAGMAAVGTLPSSGQLCAGYPPKNTCYGDSGGPLVRQQKFGINNEIYWQQVGIVSMSQHCGYNSSYPSVFVDVQSYNTWIEDKMRQ